MEILLRGKEEDGEKWLEGIGLFRDMDDFSHYQLQVKDNDGWHWHSIIPETLGLCAYKTDNTGKMIFEGDILLSCGVMLIVKFSDMSGHLIAVDKNNVVYPFLNQNRIVGNIHDNPELLKEFEDG